MDPILAHPGTIFTVNLTEFTGNNFVDDYMIYAPIIYYNKLDNHLDLRKSLPWIKYDPVTQVLTMHPSRTCLGNYSLVAFLSHNSQQSCTNKEVCLQLNLELIVGNQNPEAKGRIQNFEA